MNPPDQSPLHSPLPWYFDQSGVLRDARHYAVKLPEEGSPMHTGEELANAELIHAAVNARRELLDLLNRAAGFIGVDSDGLSGVEIEEMLKVGAEIDALLQREEKP